jgi:hypothetical protein
VTVPFPSFFLLLLTTTALLFLSVSFCYVLDSSLSILFHFSKTYDCFFHDLFLFGSAGTRFNLFSGILKHVCLGPLPVLPAATVPLLFISVDLHSAPHFAAQSLLPRRSRDPSRFYSSPRLEFEFKSILTINSKSILTINPALYHF